MTKQPRWAGFLFVITASIFWGVGGTVSQRLFQSEGVSVGWLVAVRLTAAGFLMLAISFLKDRRRLLGIWKTPSSAAQIVIFGLAGMLAVQYTYMASIQMGNAAVATLLQYLAPIFIIFYLAVSRMTKLMPRDAMAAALALGGTFLLLTDGSAGSLSIPLPAIVWGVLSGIALAFYTIYAAHLLKKWGSMNVIGWSMVIGGLAMSFFHPPWRADAAGWTTDTWLYLLFVILFGTLFSFWFYVESLKSLQPQETSVLGSLEPLAAILSSVLWLRIPFGPRQAMGAALILAMILFLALYKEKKQPASNIHTSS